MNRLKGQRAYLCGPVDRVSDRGHGWRDNISDFLIPLGVEIFNPLKKPNEVGSEDDNVAIKKAQLKKEKKWEELSIMMKKIRTTDLRMVDVCDFLVVYLDLDTHPCGTYDEVFLANSQKKPILIHIKQGKENTPDWMFGVISHDFFFSDWKSLQEYLLHVNSCDKINTYKRWYFFNSKES
jgi:nucleoside 2-deoxyribosyltransferase